MDVWKNDATLSASPRNIGLGQNLANDKHFNRLVYGKNIFYMSYQFTFALYLMKKIAWNESRQPNYTIAHNVSGL